MPRIVACGSRQNAYDDFSTALKKAGNDEFIVLLVDSEAAVSELGKPWWHLKDQDNWNMPAKATDDNAHLMVWCMEAWLIADRETLADFFGGGFKDKALPTCPNVERIPKEEIYTALENATRNCRKGQYGKGRHSFDVLARIDPDKVRKASPWAERLIETLQGKA